MGKTIGPGQVDVLGDRSGFFAEEERHGELPATTQVGPRLFLLSASFVGRTLTGRFLAVGDGRAGADGAVPPWRCASSSATRCVRRVTSAWSSRKWPTPGRIAPMRSSIVCCHCSIVCFELSTISVMRALAPAGFSPSLDGFDGGAAGGGAASVTGASRRVQAQRWARRARRRRGSACRSDPRGAARATARRAPGSDRAAYPAAPIAAAT